MPSKAKKSSKSGTKLSNSSDYSPSDTPNPNHSERTDADVVSLLQEASRKYPNFIGQNAFVGKITEDATGGGLDSKGCKIWLSEASMISYSLTPGSTVSVSVASSRKFSSTFPLRSLADQCQRHFSSAYDFKAVNEVGIYFALAVVFPSIKISKNGVRLSSSLSNTMGLPASGSLLFVYPISTQSASNLAQNNDKFQSTADDCISVFNCKELYLELVYSSSKFSMHCKQLPHIDFPAETLNPQAENGNLLSPKTPFSSRSKLSIRSDSNLSSSVHEDSLSNSNQLCGTSFVSIDIQEVLCDESAKNLLQTCATSWLCSRSLLCGNFVMIPILSKLCFFQVVGAKKISANHNILNVADEIIHDMFPQALDIVDHVDDAFVVDHKTKVYLYPPLKIQEELTQNKGIQCQEFEKERNQSASNIIIPKLGGLSREYAVLKDIIISSVKSTLSSLGIRPIKGVLLHGPSGTGKTCLAQLCAHDTGINLFHVNGPEIVSQYYGESEQALRDVFDSASQAAPAVVFIDELDSIAPARKDGSEELSQRIVATLLNLMDGIISSEGVLVIAATNRPDSIEPALRRPGRLDREIEFGVPSPDQRYDILVALLSNMKHTLLDGEVQYLASTTHGFVGADLASLCNEAAFISLRRYADSQIPCVESNFDTLVPHVSAVIMGDTNNQEDSNVQFSEDNMNTAYSSILASHVEQESLRRYSGNGACTVNDDILTMTLGDFEKARSKVRPSAMREVILEVPKVKWEDVGGQKEVKMQLMEAVEWPQKHQKSLKRIGTRPPTGVLMFGPPGCSKTLLARAVASEAGLNFLAVKGPELFSKWVGESEKAVRSLFAKARENAPSIIFFDEIDGLAIIRGKESDGVSVGDRVMSQLLVELDGLRERVNVTVIAATNRPDNIDPALLRPGRFDRLLYVGPPNEADRVDIFKIHLRKIPCSSDVCIKELAHLSTGCTGADISLICREAAIAAIEENLDASEITMEHLKSAAKQVCPSEILSNQELLMKFQRFTPSTTEKDDFNFKATSNRPSWIPFW